MSGVNKVIIVGRLGTDPEVRYTTNGTSVTNFSVATSENWNDKEGNKQERTEWHRIVVWGKMGELCSQYLKKGRQVFIEGRIQTRSWEDKEGQKRYTTEIVAQNVQFLGSREQSSSASASTGGGDSQVSPEVADQSNTQNSSAFGATDDDLPF
ncbi:MAG: single-stranded DNA-binding protein [Deltaproteobacteria bacterium]|nr:single-stranded DNA-binding protein [Deltaproteobacteria bacterium]